MRYVSHSPKDLEAIYAAFDIAWASVQSDTTANNRDAVRDSIGAAIMGLADMGMRNPTHLANYGAIIDLRF